MYVLQSSLQERQSVARHLNARLYNRGALQAHPLAKLSKDTSPLLFYVQVDRTTHLSD